MICRLVIFVRVGPSVVQNRHSVTFQSIALVSPNFAPAMSTCWMDWAVRPRLGKHIVPAGNAEPTVTNVSFSGDRLGRVQGTSAIKRMSTGLAMDIAALIYSRRNTPPVLERKFNEFDSQ